MLKYVYFFCCVSSRGRGRLGVGLCAYSESVFRKTKLFLIVCFSFLDLLLLLLSC